MGETKIVNRLLFATVFMTAALTALVAAAQSDGGSAGRQRGAMLPFEAVLRPDQKHQLYAIVKADKTKLQTLHQRLHTAREALIQKLLSPGSERGREQGNRGPQGGAGGNDRRAGHNRAGGA